MNDLQTGDIILLSGYRGHGKDTFYSRLVDGTASSRYLVSLHGSAVHCPQGRYRRLAFADVLKEKCARRLGVSLVELDARKDFPLDVHYEFQIVVPTGVATYRDVLIDVGAVKRRKDPNYFINEVSARLLADPGCITVITDWRYVNEHAVLAATMAEHGRRFFPARLHRDGAPIPGDGELVEHQLDLFHFEMKVECLY